eukprot:1527078-Rhodomonas_salina.2
MPVLQQDGHKPLTSAFAHPRAHKAVGRQLGEIRGEGRLGRPGCIEIGEGKVEGSAGKILSVSFDRGI